MNLEKWKKAVINLEGAADSQSPYKSHFQIRELSEKMNSGELTKEEFDVQMDQMFSDYSHVSRDLRYKGTAIFFKKNNDYYLLTARHVLIDKEGGQHLSELLTRNLSKIPEGFYKDSKIRLGAESKHNTVFSIFFRIPSLEEMRNGNINPPVLMNLQAGSPQVQRLTLSDEELDLGVISLNYTIERRFLNNLLENGYVPIEPEDITEEPTREGEDIFTVGYPVSVSWLGELGKDDATKNWGSDSYSLPAFSFGKISMLSDQLNYFWGDITINPGNSGGPIIENDKMVGIVSAQATYNDVGIPCGMGIKAKFINHLITEQEQKDKFLNQFQPPEVTQ